jgi:hypothetical protein
MAEEFWTAPASGSPPRARLAFRVGTVGHRPNRLKQADLTVLANVLHEVLADVKKTVEEFPSQSGNSGLYSKEAPLLRAVSPLAEGTDRLFAEQALSLGYALCCPLPFLQEEFENDFAPGQALEDHSVERFRRLLEQTNQSPDGVIFELDGDRAKAGEAYGEAGRVVLNQSDLLVVIWDGGEPQGQGGTVQTLREATQYHVPVLRIDALAPHTWDLLRSQEDLERLNSAQRHAPEPDAPPAWDDLRRIVRDTLSPPTPNEKEQLAVDLRESFFRERKPNLNLMFVWKMFRDLVDTGKFRAPTIRVQDFEDAVAKDWPVDAPIDDSRKDVAGWINRRLRPHYAWSDKLADLYADSYRSTYVLAYLLTAAAVLLALLPDAVGWKDPASIGKRACITGEILCLFAILGAWFWSRGHGHWHDRWLQYRLLAERIRQLRLLIPLGCVEPSPRLPTHLGPYDPARSWMSWHVRALARATGIPTAKVKGPYIAQSLSYIRKVVDGQAEFHKLTCQRSQRIEHRLHLVILLLLVVTIASVLIHLFSHSPFESWFTLICAGLPALAAALAGIINQGEFARIAKRSEAMDKRLDQISKDIEKLSQTNDSTPTSLKLAQAKSLAVGTAQLMVDELLDWHVIFADRPPELT